MVVNCDTVMANLCWRLFYEFYYPGFIQNPFSEPDAPPVHQAGYWLENRQQLPAHPQQNLVSHQQIDPTGYAIPVWNHSIPNQVQRNSVHIQEDQRFSIMQENVLGGNIPTKEPNGASSLRNSWENNHVDSASKYQIREKSVDRTTTEVLHQLDKGRTRERSPTPQLGKSHNRSQGGMTTTTRESEENSNFERVPVLGLNDETIEVSASEMELVRATFKKAAQRRRT